MAIGMPISVPGGGDKGFMPIFYYRFQGVIHEESGTAGPSPGRKIVDLPESHPIARYVP
jgi:hypothetical protein